MRVLEFFLVIYLALFWCLLAVLYLLVSLPIILLSNAQMPLLPDSPFAKVASEQLNDPSAIEASRH